MRQTGIVGTYVLLGALLLLPACGGRSSGAGAVPTGPSSALAAMREYPQSVNPGSIHPPPMIQTAIQPASVMTSTRRPQSATEPPGWTQIQGGGIFVAAAPGGSFWVLSSLGSGPDRAIWHYQNGTWTNIPGAAMRMAVAPTGALWVVNSAGGIYEYYNGAWTAVAGGASDITVASDNSVYIISNQMSTYGGAIYHYVGGTWVQLPGAAVRIAASWDLGTYPGGIVPGGFWVVNSVYAIYYYNPSTGFQNIPGGVVQISPTHTGGLYALGYQAQGGNYPIYYDNLNGTWTAEAGAANSISTDGIHVYVTNSAGGIYSASVSQVPAGTALTGPAYMPCSGCYGGWGPPSVASALEFPVQSGYDGTGYTVAIVIDSDVTWSDISTYLSYFDIPSTPRVLDYALIDGASTTTTSDVGEATLDVETIAGLAPGANVVLYVIPSLTSQYITDAYEQIVSYNQASIVSSSFGGCESPGASSQSGESTIFAQGASQQIAFVAASGDQGNECHLTMTTYEVSVEYPASDPNVIGVGGTETYRPDGYALTNTVAWNDTFTSNSSQEASGGGVSASFALPSYQQGVAGEASTSYRNVPDVALPAVYDGIYLSAAWGIENGTSWATPQFAAMLAEVYEYCGTSFTTPASLPYYALSKASGDFVDITSGNNQYGSSTPYYSAHTGYDNASGIGVPLGMPLAETLCPNRVPAAAVHRRLASSATAEHGPAVPTSAAVVPQVRDVVDQGRRAASTQTRIQLVLRPTPTLADDEQTVIGVLGAAGFTIVKTFSNHLVVDAVGRSDAVVGLFQTQMHDVVQGRFGARYMPVTPAVIPASLAPYVAGMSLDDVVTMTAGPHLSSSIRQ